MLWIILQHVSKFFSLPIKLSNYTPLVLFGHRLKALGITCKSSIGSTPSCSHPVEDMAQLSEVHPGNYTFYGV